MTDSTTVIARVTKCAVFDAVESKASKMERQERLAACTLSAVRLLTHASDDRASRLPSTKLTRARELLHDRMQEDLGLDEPAREIGVTKHYLVRAFERHFHAPPHRHLMQIRVERARVLLLRGDLATEVAHACGFYDQSHLNRWFQREVGLTPTRYAAARGSDPSFTLRAPALSASSACADA